MIKTPVFDDKRMMILGYLSHDEGDRRYRTFVLGVAYPKSLHQRRDPRYSDQPLVERIAFRWDSVSTPRGEHMWTVDILVTADWRHLWRLPGFISFAEEHGKEVPAVALADKA